LTNFPGGSVFRGPFDGVEKITTARSRWEKVGEFILGQKTKTPIGRRTGTGIVRSI